MSPLRIATMVSAFDKLVFPRAFEIATNTMAKYVAEGLVKLGHQVDFFAVEGSSNIEASNLVTLGMQPLHQSAVLQSIEKEVPKYQINRAIDELWILQEQKMLLEMYKRASEGQYDLVHLHCLERFLPIAAAFPSVPTIYTLHDSPNSWKEYAFKELFNLKNVYFTPISQAQKRIIEGLNYTQVCYNGIDIEQFEFSAESEDLFVFAGRISEEKGVADAVQAAKKLDVRLLIAGAIFGEASQAYFDEQIKPFLSDKIEYLGPLGRKDLAALYKRAKAVLVPMKWEEPFGLVMVEAMSCGAPIVAYKRGSAPEIVLDNQTGFLVQNLAEMIQKMQQIEQIERQNCRKHVENNFTLEQMAKSYEQAYQLVVNQ